MTQDVTTSIDAATTSGTQLAAIIEEAFASFLTSNAGTSRPVYAEAGTLWMDEANSDDLKIYHGGSDVSLIDYIGSALIARVDALEVAAEARKIPVGHIVTTNSDTTPATAYGYGTWSLVSQNRVIVGGQSGDTAGATFGNDSINILSGQLPSHTHGVGTIAVTIDPGGEHSHEVATDSAGVAGNGASTDQSVGTGTGIPTTTAPDHTHSATVSGVTASTGGGDPIDIRQSSVTYFYWLRTA